MCDYEDEKLEAGLKKVTLESQGVIHKTVFRMTDLEELRAWVASHTQELAGRTTEEVAEMAIAVGFNRAVVDMWKSGERFKRAG